MNNEIRNEAQYISYGKQIRPGEDHAEISVSEQLPEEGRAVSRRYAFSAARKDRSECEGRKNIISLV
jgi:hypothetical protein